MKAVGAGSRKDAKIAQWPLPLKGHWSGVDDAAIPSDALLASENITVRAGRVVARPGITSLSAVVIGSRPTGAMFYNSTDQVPYVLVGALDDVLVYDFTTLSSLAATPGGDADNPMRMTKLSFGTPLVNFAYFCNNKSAFGLQRWRDGDTALTSVAGAPTFKDITMVNDRLVGLVGAYGVQWGEPLEDATWPVANVKSLAETDAETVAVTNFGIMGGVVYKRDSIFLFTPTGETGGEAFCFQYIGKFDGPAGAPAVVHLDNTDSYMTQSGRIALYTGSSHAWILDGLWDVVRSEIDQDFPDRVTGWHDNENDEIWYTYPRIGDAGVNLGVVVVKIKRPDIGYDNYFGFHGELTYPITAGLRVNKSSIKNPIVFTATGSDERMFSLEGTQDDDTAFNCSFQTGMEPLDQAEVTRILYVEPFMERDAAFGTANVQLASSFILDDPAGVLAPPQPIDLTATPIKDVIPFDVRSRFLAVRYSWTSTNVVRYFGTVVRGAEAD